MQVCRTGRAQNLVARLREKADIVGSFFTPNRQIQNQVLICTRNFQRCRTSPRWVLPASHRALTKVQNRCISRFHEGSGSHPQPSANRKKQNRSSGQPHLDAAPLAGCFSTEPGEVLEAWTTGAEMVKPRHRLRQRQLMGSYFPENGRVGATYALCVWKLARQTPRQHIQDALLFIDGVALIDQNLPLANLASKPTAKFTASRAPLSSRSNLTPHRQIGRGAARERNGIEV